MILVLSFLDEQKFVLDVQAAHKLSKNDWNSSALNNKILQAGRKANTILTNENLYLILQETKKFFPDQEPSSYSQYRVEYADQPCWQEYVHEGILGLHEAIIRFEIARGFRLSSFALTWIRGSISRLSKRKKIVNISYKQAEEYSLASDSVQEVISISSQELELIQSFVNALNPIDRDIINRCFGLNDYTKNSLIAIGRCNNLSAKQVARRRDRILRKLRSLLDNEDNTKQNKAILHCLSNDISLLAS